VPRLIKLFRYSEHLHRIVRAVLAERVPVASSLVLMLMVTAIYSIIATMLFREQSPEYFCTFSGKYPNPHTDWQSVDKYKHDSSRSTSKKYQHAYFDFFQNPTSRCFRWLQVTAGRMLSPDHFAAIRMAMSPREQSPSSPHTSSLLGSCS